MKKISYSVVAAALLSSSAPLFASDESVVATVNGSPVTAEQLNNYGQARQSQGGAVPQQMILDELINRELITQDANKRGINKDDEFVRTLKEQQTNLLAAYAIQRMIQQAGSITDETLQAEYDNYLSTITEQEYRASHILLENEQDAIDAIAALDKGENFAKLAESKSVGPSAPEGGSLGWFRPEQMVEPFAEALVALEQGKHSSQPVQTQFGWHVILLEETRTLPAPSFESLREQLQNNLINQRVQNYIKELRNRANIVLNDK